MNKPVPVRDKAITTACYIGWIIHLSGLVVLLFYEPSPSWREYIAAAYGEHYFPFRAVVMIALSVALIGFWFMRRIGVYVYILVSVVYMA